MGVALVFIFIVLTAYLIALVKSLKEFKLNKIMVEMYGSTITKERLEREIRIIENKITFVFVGLIACLIFYLIFIFTN